MHKIKLKHGSILVYSMIILAIMLTIALGMSKVAVTEKKNASTTDASVQSYQTADSGVQLLISKITKATPVQKLSDITTCSAGKVTGTAGGGAYTASFFTDENATPASVISDCNALASTVKNIKSVGTYNNTARAVSVAVQPACNTTTDIPDRSVYAIKYREVRAEDGKCWLDRNLGAPNVATAFNDYANYGWLFQWGRGADGHQLVTLTNTAPYYTSKSSQTAGPVASQTPGANFITTFSSPNDWLSPKDDTLWAGASGGINNPCPVGFRLPTGGVYTGTPDSNGAMQGEWIHVLALTQDPNRGAGNYLSTCISNCRDSFARSSLKLPHAGDRNFNGSLLNQGGIGLYWSSSPTSHTAHAQHFHGGGAWADFSPDRTFGASVRCVMD